jgi:hypothetical protein
MNDDRNADYGTNVNAAWTGVEDAVDRATELYVTEVSAYLNWARDLQRELLEESLLATQAISRFGEKQLAFFARIRDRAPAFGGVPKGTETVAGMVEAVVQETEPRA